MYQCVFAHSNVNGPFTLCTVSPSRQELTLGQKSISEWGIVAPCLLVVEEGSSLGEDEWLDVISGVN